MVPRSVGDTLERLVVPLNWASCDEITLTRYRFNIRRGSPTCIRRKNRADPGHTRIANSPPTCDDTRFLGKLDNCKRMVLSVEDLFFNAFEKGKASALGPPLEADGMRGADSFSNAGGIPELNLNASPQGFALQCGESVQDMKEKALFILDEKTLPTFKANA